ERRQGPADAVLGDQAAARERGRELRLRGGETQIAVERDDEAEPGARAVDGGDDRLGDRGEIRVPLLEIRPGARVERRGRRRDRARAAILGETRKPRHVGTGAETAAGAGE